VTCPHDSFAVLTRSSGYEYRMCVRQPPTDAVGTYLGESIVDRYVRDYGEWGECMDVARLLPPRHGMGTSTCIALDVGANIGSCTLLFSRLGYNTIAVEAEPANYELLHSSLLLPQPHATDFANVSVARVAAGAYKGFAHITRDPDNGGFSAVGEAANSSLDEARPVFDVRDPMYSSVIPVDLLDDIVSDHATRLGSRLEDVCLMKIDVEGSEMNVLRGAHRLLSGPVRAIQIEFCPAYCQAHNLELLQLLVHYGFTIYGSRRASPTIEERAYLPSELGDLVERLTQGRYMGNNLHAVKL